MTIPAENEDSISCLGDVLDELTSEGITVSVMKQGAVFRLEKLEELAEETDDDGGEKDGVPNGAEDAIGAIMSTHRHNESHDTSYLDPNSTIFNPHPETPS